MSWVPDAVTTAAVAAATGDAPPATEIPPGTPLGDGAPEEVPLPPSSNTSLAPPPAALEAPAPPEKPPGAPPGSLPLPGELPVTQRVSIDDWMPVPAGEDRPVIVAAVAATTGPVCCDNGCCGNGCCGEGCRFVALGPSDRRTKALAANDVDAAVAGGDDVDPGVGGTGGCAGTDRRSPCQKAWVEPACDSPGGTPWALPSGADTPCGGTTAAGADPKAAVCCCVGYGGCSTVCGEYPRWGPTPGGPGPLEPEPGGPDPKAPWPPAAGAP